VKAPLILLVLVVTGGLVVLFVGGDEPERLPRGSVGDEFILRDVEPIAEKSSTVETVQSSSSGSIVDNPKQLDRGTIEASENELERTLRERGIPLFDSQGLPLSEVQMLGLLKTLNLRDLRLEIGAKSFGQRIDDFLLTEEVDQDWANAAMPQINAWLQTDDNVVRFGECFSSVCYLDVSTTSSKFMADIAPQLRQWGQDPVPGFLPMLYSYPVGQDFNRVFFFRDSFDPGAIGAVSVARPQS